jgi:cell division protein FtsL
MAAIIHGNLAVNEEKRSRVRYEVSKRKVVKKATIPPAEKLMYLFSILIFVVVSGILVSRVTESYENNYKIQELQTQIESLSEQNSVLETEIRSLLAPERIIGIAEKQLGLTQSDSQVHMGKENVHAKTASR